MSLRLALLLAAVLLAGPVRADRYYRISRDGQTIGMLHEEPEVEGREAGRIVRIRTTRIALVASYVGTRELHTFRERCHLDLETGKVVSFRAEYRQGRREENRTVRFEGRQAILQIVVRGGPPEERSIDLPRGAFLPTGPRAVAEWIATGSFMPGRSFPVVDPRTLAIETGEFSAPAADTIDVLGRSVSCQVYILRIGERTTRYWLSGETGEVMRLREDGVAPTLFERTDASIVEEIDHLDVTVPPLTRRRDLPWKFGIEYRYDFLVDGTPGGSIRFTLEPVESGIEVSSQFEIEHSPRRWEGRAVTRYDASLVPISFSFEGTQSRPDREISTGIGLTRDGGRMRVAYRQDNRQLDNRTPVPPGCQIVHDNNMEHFAVFLSQIDLVPLRTNRLNVFHPRLFRAFLLEVVTGEWEDSERGRRLPAKLQSDYFSADLLFDEDGRLLAYLRGNTEIRLAE